MAVLEISKLVMYEYHYNHIRPKYGKQCQICYTDTGERFFFGVNVMSVILPFHLSFADSFIYLFTGTEDIYTDELKANSHL